ncbi:glycine--tRNA ligase subunit beta [Herminiimonas contaminans]|uniref:Glycine--tRNA ligase beta subunit n=1 Tax=Herminiimonas contaminans TaxID=1111140 RepID=A0ABS0ERT0_9BURK|nr:glycine--tRNA ligase subunit beta [Herminiimonas contaminans]MBF8177547.1 glycine--tRNA ligase subunit beta [Herminiimonas contaminans]
MSTQNLLLELFVEELPPKALKKIGAAFAETLQASLQAQGLLSADSVLTAFASPRRLGVHLTKVLEQADDKAVMQKLMPAAVGLGADGKATPALLKKLAALGADESAVAGLKRESDGKADVLYFNSTITGVMLSDGLQKALEETLGKLPIPKVMAYQLADGWETVNFVRPAHGLVAMYGADVLPISALGLRAGCTTHGHRFEAGIDPVYIRNADSYAAQIATEGAVIASFAERRAEIVRQLAVAAAEAGSNLTPIEDEALLDEVTGLVERPNVLIGQFEEAFLEVPQECLILTMKANQKYFPLLDSKGNLSNKFLIVSNIRPADASTVIGGNERVVRPRLADAKFFFDQDRKKTLASRVAGLDKVVYHNKLGTQGERIARVRAIAQAIAGKLGVDAQQADTAAQLAKADLLTDMVGEFPELQGIMGRYYAQHDGLPATVADAIEDHYKPRFAGDELPRNPVGIVVALADKLETLVGLFSIGQVPTGDKDPFALRRHALGIIRMLIESKLDIGINDLIAAAEKPFNGLSAEHRGALLTFIFDRLANALREQGYSAQEIDAVLALQPQRLADVADRLAAVRAFAALPEAASLAAANKRVGNILKKVEGTVAAQVDTALLKEPAEVALNQTLTTVKPQAEAAFARGDYTASLQALAALRNPVDAFFDGVMVNAEDVALRNNRQGLLATLHQAMNQVADISKLAA